MEEKPNSKPESSSESKNTSLQGSIKTARVFRIESDGNASFIGELEADWAYKTTQSKKDEKAALRFYCPACDEDSGDYCTARLYPRRYKSSVVSGSHFIYSFSTMPNQVHNHEMETRKYNISPAVKSNCASFLKAILKPRKQKIKEENSIDILPTFDLPVKELPIIQPRTIVDYYIQTRMCDPASLMPKSSHTFGDCLVNSYSIQEFRNGEKEFGKPMLVLARQADPLISKEIKQQWSVVLSDPFGIPDGKDNTDRLHFILHSNPDKFEALQNATQDSRGILLVLCEWKESELRSISTENGEKVECRVVEGKISKPSVQIRQLKRKLFNYFEQY